jgi:hypothetical protein
MMSGEEPTDTTVEVGPEQQQEVLVGDEDLELVVGMRTVGRRCCECGSPWADKHCAACKVASYCSTACQRASWKAVHKVNCQLNPTAPLQLKTATSYPPAATTALSQWLVLPPHAKLPRTREDLAALITAADSAAAGPAVYTEAHCWQSSRMAAVCGYGAEDVSALFCVYNAEYPVPESASTGSGGAVGGGRGGDGTMPEASNTTATATARGSEGDGSGGGTGSGGTNASARQLLNGVADGHAGAVLLCRAATGGVDLETLTLEGHSELHLLPLSPAHVANVVMRRAEAGFCGGHSDRMPVTISVSCSAYVAVCSLCAGMGGRKGVCLRACVCVCGGGGGGGGLR